MAQTELRGVEGVEWSRLVVRAKSSSLQSDPVAGCWRQDEAVRRRCKARSAALQKQERPGTCPVDPEPTANVAKSDLEGAVSAAW